MRIVLPDGFQNRGGLAQIVFAQIGLRCNQCRRNEAFCELESVLGILARAHRVAFQLFTGLGGEKHGFQPLRLAAFDDACRFLLVEQADGIVPLSVAAAVFQRRLCCPWQIGGFFRSIFGILLGGFIGALPARFDIKAAKAEFARFRVTGHRLELAARLVIFAFDEVGLRIEQMDQRFLIGAEQPLRAGRHLAGEDGITSAGGNEAGGQSLIAAVALPGAEIPACGIGRGPDGVDDPPDQHDGGNQRGDDGGGDHQAHFDQLALPDDGEHARPVGQPGETETESQNDNGESQNSGHALTPACQCW
ncbi:hypothetical protein D3C78_822970 [compost metagenome]